MTDLDAAVDYLRSRAAVDTTRMLSGGTSRGGILANDAALWSADLGAWIDALSPP